MSIFSPFPVADDEVVTRIIFSPIHFKNGKIKPAAFSHAETKGCSVNREQFVTKKTLINFVQNSLQKNPTWSFQGATQASVKDLRSIRVENARAYCVYDIADCDNPAHSEIHMASDMIDPDRLEARAKLFKAFNTETVISPNH